MSATLILTGRLGKDPETRTSQKGTSFTKFSIAHDENGRDGQKTTTWYSVTCFGQKSTYASQYLHKGDLVQVMGPLKIDTFQGNDGQTKVMPSVTANELEKLGGGRGNGGGNYQNGGGYMQEARPAGGGGGGNTYQKPQQQNMMQEEPPYDQGGGVPF